MMTARRIGRAVNGSYVEFSSSTPRRPPMEPSWLVLGGWVSTLCSTRVCAWVTEAPDKPAAVPGCRWPRLFLRCAIRPPTDSPPWIGVDRITNWSVSAGHSGEHPVTRPPDRRDRRTRHNGAVTQSQRSFYDEVGGDE